MCSNFLLEEHLSGWITAHLTDFFFLTNHPFKTQFNNLGIAIQNPAMWNGSWMPTDRSCWVRHAMAGVGGVRGVSCFESRTEAELWLEGSTHHFHGTATTPDHSAGFHAQPSAFHINEHYLLLPCSISLHNLATRKHSLRGMCACQSKQTAQPSFTPNDKQSKPAQSSDYFLMFFPWHSMLAVIFHHFT